LLYNLGSAFHSASLLLHFPPVHFCPYRIFHSRVLVAFLPFGRRFVYASSSSWQSRYSSFEWQCANESFQTTGGLSTAPGAEHYRLPASKHVCYILQRTITLLGDHAFAAATWCTINVSLCMVQS